MVFCRYQTQNLKKTMDKQFEVGQRSYCGEGLKKTRRGLTQQNFPVFAVSSLNPTDQFFWACPTTQIVDFAFTYLLSTPSTVNTWLPVCREISGLNHVI